jgi:hypothetical protein
MACAAGVVRRVRASIQSSGWLLVATISAAGLWPRYPSQGGAPGGSQRRRSRGRALPKRPCQRSRGAAVMCC